MVQASVWPKALLMVQASVWPKALLTLKRPKALLTLKQKSQYLLSLMLLVMCCLPLGCC
jgi:hypothetical protein